jgi:hypothetical protein
MHLILQWTLFYINSLCGCELDRNGIINGHFAAFCDEATESPPWTFESVQRDVKLVALGVHGIACGPFGHPCCVVQKPSMESCTLHTIVSVPFCVPPAASQGWPEWDVFGLVCCVETGVFQGLALLDMIGHLNPSFAETHESHFLRELCYCYHGKCIVSRKNHNGPSLYFAWTLFIVCFPLEWREPWTHVIFLLDFGLGFDRKGTTGTHSDLNRSPQQWWKSHNHMSPSILCGY